jgi:hypothetical protein
LHERSKNFVVGKEKHRELNGNIKQIGNDDHVKADEG